MDGYCVTIDIGASNGRVIIVKVENEVLETKEIYRFPNAMKESKGHYIWDIDHLVNSVLTGLKLCLPYPILSVGIDTWAVDYVLLGKNDEILDEVYAYRDERNQKAFEEYFASNDKYAVYQKTGIQFLPFNTIYQLFAHQKQSYILNEAKQLLLLPDYLQYVLTGKSYLEYTNATTMQLLDVNTHSFDEFLLGSIGVSKELFPELIYPGDKVGLLKETIGFKNDVQVIAPGTHDTSSSIAASIAFDDSWCYISSGTWSLMGVELKEAITSEASYAYNFTNNGGVYGTITYLKNIMGLWLIQEVKRLMADNLSYGEIVSLAEKEVPFRTIINPNHSSFLNPSNMLEAIKSFALKTKQPVPKSLGQVARCIYDSLALLYKKTHQELVEVTNRKIDKINIIGGGCQNEFLNQLTADVTGCDVYAGPVETASLGNALVQLISLGIIKDIKEGRRIVSNSFNIKVFKPQMINIDYEYQKFLSLIREDL